MKSRYISPALHILIWGLLLAIPGIVTGNEKFYGLSKTFFYASSIFHIGLFYFNAFFLYPKLLTKKWWWLYIICLAAIVRLSFEVKMYLLQLSPDFTRTHENERIVLFGIAPFVIASIIFRLVSDRIRFERMEKEARAERLDAELKFLRSQISPHFLFNMMANLVSLARQKSDLLEPSLIKLSELLRYMLYDSAGEKIALSKEIENLENYIALQQLRFGDDVQVNIEIEDSNRLSNWNGYLIEPMLLVPFIENAFKHGIGIQPDPYINVRLILNGKQLRFTVVNNFNATDLSKDKNSGIGLVNVKNRLGLLYPAKYELAISNDQQTFSVTLNLDLS